MGIPRYMPEWDRPEGLARSKSEHPPAKVYYVTRGRAALNNGRLYKAKGWATRWARESSKGTRLVRVWVAQPEWTEVTADIGDLADESEVRALVGWAAESRIRRFLLGSTATAHFVQERPRLDRIVDLAEAPLRSLRGTGRLVRRRVRRR